MSSNTIGIVEMIAMLNEDSYSVTQIAMKTGLHRQSIMKYLKLFHKRRLVRIAEYHQFFRNRLFTPCYEWNPDGKPDVKKPEPLTRSQVAQRYRDRKAQKAALL